MSILKSIIKFVTLPLLRFSSFVKFAVRKGLFVKSTKIIDFINACLNNFNLTFALQFNLKLLRHALVKSMILGDLNKQTANLIKEENLTKGKVTNFRMLFKILIEQSPSDKTRIKENLSKS